MGKVVLKYPDDLAQAVQMTAEELESQIRLMAAPLLKCETSVLIAQHICSDLSML